MSFSKKKLLFITTQPLVLVIFGAAVVFASVGIIIQGGLIPSPTPSTPVPPTATATKSPALTHLPTPLTPTLRPPFTPTWTPTTTSVPPTDTPSPTPDPTIEYYKAILEEAGVLVDGKIRVGVRYDAPPFGDNPDLRQELSDDPIERKEEEKDLCDPKSPFDPNFESKLIGYDIRIAHELAQRWLGDWNAVEFRCVPVGKRGETIHDSTGGVFIGIFSYAYSENRCNPTQPEGVLCSESYMLDGQGVLTYEGSDISDLCKVRGKRVAILSSTSAEENFRAGAIRFCGTPEPILDPVDNKMYDRTFAIGKVSSKEDDAYATNFEIVRALANENPTDNLAFVPGEFGPAEPFVIAVTPGKEAVLNLIDEAITEWRDDLTLLEWMKEAGFECVSNPDPKLQENLCGLRPIEDAIPSYPVRPGDTLSGIAGTLWGDSNLWPCIADANGDKEISREHPVIQDDTTITIPPKPAQPYPDPDNPDPDNPDPDTVNCAP